MAQVLASSFPYEQPDCRPADRPAGECRIRFTGENHKFMILPASAVLHDHATDRRFSKYLDGRIVLIGGTYAAGRDRYASGGKYYSGVEILAHEIESELTGPIYEVSSRVAFSVSLGLSVILYTIAFHLPPILDLPFSFVFLCVFSFGSGWILYHYDHRFFPIGSALLSLPFGIIVEHCVGCRFLEQLLQPREAEG